MIIDPDTLLESYNSTMLWDMARVGRIPGAGGTKPKKADLMRLMRQEFFTPERIKASYQRLSERERDILNRLLLRGGESSTRMFKRELLRAELVTEAPPYEPPKKEKSWYAPRGPSIYGRTVNYIADVSKTKSTIFEDVVARLTLQGLIFSSSTPTNTGGTNFKLQFHPADIIFVPAFVRRHLPQPEPLPEKESGWQPTSTLSGDPHLLLRDLYLYWDTVRSSDIAFINSGFIGKRGLQQLNAALLSPDPTLNQAKQEDQTGHLFLLRQLLEELKLVQSQGGKLHPTAKSNRSIPEFWQMGTVEQVSAVLKVWRAVSQPLLFPGDGKYYRYTFHVRQAFNLLLTAMAELPAAWIEADDLLVWLQERNSDFLFPERGRIEKGGYYGSYYYSNRPDTIAEMDELERKFVTQAVGNAAYQLGLIELGFNEQTSDPIKWKAYRLTPLGSAVLQNKLYQTDALTGQIIVQPNFQILAMGPVPLNLLAQLDLFAEREKVDRTTFEYHISRESVYTAQQLGYTVDDVQRFLESVSPNELPQNIRRTLTEWAAHHDRIVFRRGVTLLQAADETLLERLLADEETGKLLARPVGTAVALVKTKQQTRLIEALQSSGLLPAVSGADPEAADKSVMIDENGRIQPIHAVPSLHLRGRISRFAEETAEGWLLTERSISRAGGSKKKVQNLINELSKLSRGRLSENLITRIRAWGGYYGSASVETLTLFEFRDQETLAELRQMPELEELLKPFQAGNRALAAVDSDQVTAVQSILRQLGIQVIKL